MRLFNTISKLRILGRSMKISTFNKTIHPQIDEKKRPVQSIANQHDDATDPNTNERPPPSNFPAHTYLLTVHLFSDNAPREHVYFCFGPVFQTAAKSRFIGRILAPSPMALCHFGEVHRLAVGFNVIESDTKNVPSVSVCLCVSSICERGGSIPRSCRWQGIRAWRLLFATYYAVLCHVV